MAINTDKTLPPTFAEHMISRGSAIVDEVTKFLNEHAILEYVNPDHGLFVVISMHGDYAYRETEIEGQRLLGKVRQSFKQYTELLDTVLHQQGSDILREYKEGCECISNILEQNWTHSNSIEEEVAKVAAATKKMLSVFDKLHDSGNGSTILIPDTNALLTNPELETWNFEGLEPFCLLLTPTVLAELDRLKIEHRSPEVREKAQKLIRKFKEFRRRGSLLNGVPLVKKRSEVRAIALEPIFENSLPWIDKNVNDDRILASIIEVIRLHPRSSVYAISYDINFQNKAEYAGVQFVEPS